MPFLLFLSALFFAVVKIRLFIYKSGLLRPGKLPKPVISVGNITWGGTGKTPLAEAILKHIQRKGFKAALLTRGYGKDEDRMLSSNIPGIKVISGKNRLSNALNYIRGNSVDVFVLDDGFQHLQIKRDLDIVTINARCPFGNKYVIPAGILREPLKSLKRADIAVITKSNLAAENDIIEIKSIIKNISPSISIFQAEHVPESFYTAYGDSKPLGYIKNRHVVSVSALADNDSFIKTLESLGAKVRRNFSYIDHYRYSKRDLIKIKQALRAFGIKIAVSTEKDWMKLKHWTKILLDKETEILILKIRLEVKEDEVFYRRLSAVLRG
jgi:tetraacyldisaccharide 4'-kinase